LKIEDSESGEAMSINEFGEKRDSF